MSGLGSQMGRLARHSAIYGIGGLVSRFVAVLLLPLYTRYLTPADYGAVETLVALMAIFATILRLGIASAFFRFYFDSPDPAHRLRVVRTSFWFTMGMATIGLVVGMAIASQISQWLFDTTDHTTLVRSAFVLLWVQMNYEQLTALFRAEERSVAFVIASLVNLVITVGATVLFVVVLDWGATGVIVGNFTGTLAVWVGLVAYRREQLGLTFDRPLLRKMNRFGLPLVPSMLALWLLNFGDRIFILQLSDVSEVGLYSIGARIASAMVLLLDRVPRRLARVRVLDRGRRGSEALLRVRAHLSALRRVVGGARARPAGAVDRRVADDTEVPRLGGGGGTARVRRRRLRRLHRRLDRARPDEADPVQLGRHRRRCSRRRDDEPRSSSRSTGWSGQRSRT